jgi:hypothetical protein
VVADWLECDSGLLEHRALREHRREGVHLVGVRKRPPDAHVRQEPALAIDADVVMKQPAELLERVAERRFARRRIGNLS